MFCLYFIILLVGLSFIGLKSMGNHEGKVLVQVESDGSIIESVEMSGGPEAEGSVRGGAED